MLYVIVKKYKALPVCIVLSIVGGLFGVKIKLFFFQAFLFFFPSP